MLSLLLSVIAKSWFEARITNSIKAEYDTSLEGYKAELQTSLAEYTNTLQTSLEEFKSALQRSLEDYKENVRRSSLKREKATAVVEVLSKWLEGDYDDEVNENRARWELQQKYWELLLWLDIDTIRILNRALAGEEKTPGLEGENFRLALAAVRKLNLGLLNDDFNREEILVWAPLKTKSLQPVGVSSDNDA